MLPAVHGRRLPCRRVSGYRIPARPARPARTPARAAGPGTTGEQAQELRDRWPGYQDAHERIVALADGGETSAAIDALTGIRRGVAAFDFYYFDAAISQLADDRRESFDLAMRDAQRLLAGWSVIPIVAIGTVIVLVLLGLWPRLAEYR